MSRRGASTRDYMRGLLESEDGQRRLQEMFEDVTEKRMRRVTSLNCPRCREMKKLDVEVEAYNIKEATAFLRLLADFGVGKPAEEKNVNISAEVFAKPLHELTDDEIRHELEAASQ